MKEQIPAAARHYAKELMDEVNADREAHGKKPFDDDNDPPASPKKHKDNTSTVIMSWCIQYAVLSLKGFQSYDIVGLDNLFQQVSNGWLNAGLSVVLLLLTALVVSKDISKGIEKVGKVMTPALYVILIVLAIRVLFLPGAVDGLNYLFDISADSFFSSDKLVFSELSFEEKKIVAAQFIERIEVFENSAEIKWAV